eukprot:7220955-Ditylum_brightwellii.AAC.1
MLQRQLHRNIGRGSGKISRYFTTRLKSDISTSYAFACIFGHGLDTVISTQLPCYQHRITPPKSMKTAKPVHDLSQPNQSSFIRTLSLNSAVSVRDFLRKER